MVYLMMPGVQRDLTSPRRDSDIRNRYSNEQLEDEDNGSEKDEDMETDVFDNEVGHSPAHALLPHCVSD